MLVPAVAGAQDRGPLNDATPGAGTVMEAIVDSVSATRIEADIRQLAGFGIGYVGGDLPGVFDEIEDQISFSSHLRLGRKLTAAIDVDRAGEVYHHAR